MRSGLEIELVPLKSRKQLAVEEVGDEVTEDLLDESDMTKAAN